MFSELNDFSNLDRSISRLKEDAETRRELLSAPPFAEVEMTKKATEARVKSALADFWAFDKIYFPAEMYSGGYFKPCQLHTDIVEISQKPGVHVIFGARGHGKTVTAKKVLIWLFLTGKVRLAGTYAETIDKARNILADIAELILGNDRIMNDFTPEFRERNADKLQFRFMNAANKKWRYLQTFSEGRSVRGYGRQFDRPQFLLGDDVETLESSMAIDSIEKRILKLQESFLSLAENQRTFIIMGNDFDKNSALHRIRVEQEAGILSPSWKVYSYPAWNEAEGKPLWASRYRVKSEFALKKLLQPRDEFDWQANFQQNPISPEGIYFKRENLQFWEKVPDDARGVLYVDPNLSKKGKGDTTAITALKFSAETQQFYVVEAKCRSYSDSVKLLDDVWAIVQRNSIVALGMDGHVTQESIWTDNIRTWSKLKGKPFPPIEFLRLNIDDLAKNLQIAWVDGRILFPPNFTASDDGKRYIEQLIAFRGKKANKTDDAPDSLIGAFTLIHSRHFVRRGKNLLAKSVLDERVGRF